MSKTRVILVAASALAFSGCHFADRWHQPAPVHFKSTAPSMVRSPIQQVAFQQSDAWQAPRSHPVDEALIAAWSPFQNPRLQTLQEIALERASTSAIQNRLSSLGIQPKGSYADVRRRLLSEIAEMYADIRYQQEYLQMINWTVKRQKKAMKIAEIRNQVGNKQVELVKIQDQIDHLERKVENYRQTIARDGIRLGALLGRTPTAALIKAIGDQPQLHLPEIDSGLPASVLRRRCDVREAETYVLAQSSQSGIPEAEMIPMLALRGNIQTLKSQSDANADIGGGVDFAFGDSSSWSHTLPDVQTLADDRYTSPIHSVMRNYQQVVFMAADEVEFLLTEYKNSRATVVELQSKVLKAKATAEDNIDKLEYDRMTADELVLAHIIVLQLADDLANAQAKQAKDALKLFEAIGGQCQSDGYGQASYYNYGSGLAQ